MSQIVHLSLTLPCHMLVPTLLPLQPGHGVTRVSPQTFLLGHSESGLLKWLFSFIDQI